MGTGKLHNKTNNFIFQIIFFWLVTPCSDVVGYQYFGGPCCLHLQGAVTWTWNFNQVQGVLKYVQRPFVISYEVRAEHATTWNFVPLPGTLVCERNSDRYAFQSVKIQRKKEVYRPRGVTILFRSWRSSAFPRGSLVSIVTKVPGWTTVVAFPTETGIFPFVRASGPFLSPPNLLSNGCGGYEQIPKERAPVPFVQEAGWVKFRPGMWK
jgi:hypothetical protein